MGRNRHGRPKSKPHTLRHSKTQQKENYSTEASETNLNAASSRPEPTPTTTDTKATSPNDASKAKSENDSNPLASSEKSSIVDGAFEILPDAWTYWEPELLDPVVTDFNEALLRFFMDSYLRYPICREKSEKWWPQLDSRSDYIEKEIPKWAAANGFDVEHCFQTLG